MKNLIFSAALIASAFSYQPSPVQAQEVTNCTAITSLPATISASGVYCMMQNLGTNITSGAAITITANNVTFNMNGFRLGGSTAGSTTQATGILAFERRNITIRNGTIRGFKVGMEFGEGTPDKSSGHLIENMLLDRLTSVGIRIQGTGIQIRNNTIVDIDSTGPAGILPVNGITAADVSNSVIEGNFISRLISSSQTFGIIIGSSRNINVFGNTIQQIQGGNQASGIAINVGSLGNIAIQRNTIQNVTSGGSARGINSASGTNINCFDNVIVGPVQTSGCTNEAGTRP